MPGPATFSKNIWQFDPRSIGGCQLWLDGADLTTMYQDTAGTIPTTTGSTKVYRWRDKSSLSNAFVSYVGVSGTDPAYQTGGGIFFSNDAPNFNSNTYACMGSTTNFQNTYYFTVAMCVYYQQGVALPNSWGLSTLFESNALNDNGSARSPQWGISTSFTEGQTTPLAFSNYRESVGDYNGFQTEGKINTKTVMILTSGPLSNAVYSDGTGVASYGCSNGAGAYLPYLSRSGNGPWIAGWFNNLAPAAGKNSVSSSLSATDNRWAKGYIYEVLFYNSELTFDQRQAVEGYLAWKWGTNSSLPTIHPFYSIKPLARAFNPTDIPNCVQWLDSADPSTIYSSYPGTLATNGSTVTYWFDKSGTGNSVSQNGASNCPTYTTASNALNFASGGGLYNSTGYALSPNVSFFAVIISPGTGWGTWGTLWGHFRINGHDADIQFRQTSNSGYANWHTNNDNNNYSAAVIPASGTLAMYSCTMSNGVNMFLQASYSGSTNSNAYTEGTSTISTGTVAPLWVGRSDYAESYNGYICELIYYNTVLTTSQRQEVEGYLAWKWGLTSSLTSSPAHPFYKIPPSLTSKFNPISILGCQLWYDATDPNASGNGSTVTTVSTWYDKSGNGSNATAVGSISLVQNAINGLPAVWFTGGSSNGYFTGSMSDVGPSMSIFIVMNPFAYALRLFSFAIPGQADVNALGYGFLGYNGSQFLGYRGGTAGPYQSGTSSTYNPYIVNLWWDGTNGYIAVNGGTVVSQAATVSFAVSSFAIGVDQVVTGDGQVCNGYMGELIVYNTALTLPQRQQVEGYLSGKWRIALATTHPYYKIRPGLTYSGGITPSALANLVVWNRADNSSLSGGVWTNYGSGGTISCSGTLSTGVLNGLSVVNFTTSQTWTSSTFFNPTSYTFIQVVRQTTGTYGRVFQGTSGYNDLHGFWAGSNQVWWLEGNPSFLNGLPSTSGVNLWNIVSETRVASGAYEFRWNGCTVRSGTTSTATGLEGLAVNTGGTNEPSTCQLAEVILYSNVLNKVQLIGVENYLKVKWGL
jgi:hypothetical protein